MIELMDQLEIMKQVAKQAGEFMLGAADLTESTIKANANDFVTVADIKSQNLIRKELQKHFPDSVILSEEDSETERQALFAPDFSGFIIDPIDGTYNFKRGMQESAISIGYIENGEPIAGVIYDAYKNELFSTAKGHGAFCNDRPIQVSQQTTLAGASVATSNGYDYEAAVRNLNRQIGIYDQSGVMPWFSCPGSAVLAMAWVAAGRIDAIHHNGFKPFDNAAAFLLVSEAGGSVTGLNGEAVRFTDSVVLLGTPAITKILLETFQKLPPELLQ